VAVSEVNKMQVKVSELSGAALDWAVAICVAKHDIPPVYKVLERGTRKVYQSFGQAQMGYSFGPSTNWAQGGLIIDREEIALGKSWGCWKAFTETAEGQGPTPLIAAMRCFVASKLGEVVDIPDSLA
jgi:Protein of unknown function (DUF2591)